MQASLDSAGVDAKKIRALKQSLQESQAKAAAAKKKKKGWGALKGMMSPRSGKLSGGSPKSPKSTM